jgi:hypothetical protein
MKLNEANYEQEEFQPSRPHLPQYTPPSPGDDELIAQPSTTTSATLQLLDVQLIALTS